MNRKLLTPLLLFSLYLCTGYGNSFKITGDSTSCILFFELNQNENEEYVVSLIPDTTWTFPRNIVSTAQVTVKVPTGVFEVGEPTDLIEGVTFFKSGRDNSPSEDPQFDYISFSLGTQGTTRIPFEKGQKVDLFAFANTGTCPNGIVSLMDNFTDPFYPPNSKQSNAGQQMTVSGYGAPDLPVGILGNGINCNPDNTTPVDTMGTTPVDTMNTTPVDTMDTTPVDTMGTTPVDTTDTGGTPPVVDSGLTVQIASQAISCNGANDGIVVLKVDNGQPPYVYSWNTGATTSSIENLTPGTYSVMIQDATGFVIERTITIIEAAPLELVVTPSNPTTAGVNNGSANAAVLGGTSPYSYQWSNSAISSSINNLTAGSYSLTVTDAHGCTAIQSFSITAPIQQCPQLNIALDMRMPSCAGESDGQILATPLNGTAPFTYAWENGNTNNTITNIPTGNYMVTVTDGAGCTTAVSAMLPDATPLSINVTTTTNGISTSITGGAPPYLYSWSNGASSSSISNLEAGTYALTVTDNLGCAQTASAVITTTNTGNNCNSTILNSFGSSIVLPEVSCDEKGTLCLPIPFDSMTQYSIFLDGDDYSSNLAGCQFETYFAYSYAFFPAGNTTGSYNLTEWTVNGTTYSGAFTSIDDLVANMNIWDPNGNWVNVKSVSIIQGGNPTTTYGGMVLVSGTASTILDVNSNLTPTGTEITFKPGVHQLTVTKIATSCTETLTIDLPCTNTGTSQDTVISLSINEGEEISVCLVPIFGGNISVSTNNCPTLSGTAATVTFDNGGNCIDIQGLMFGTNEACYTITNNNTGETINLTVIINVVTSGIPCIEYTQDSIFAFAPSCNPLSVCLDIPYNVLSNATIRANDDIYTGGVTPCSNDGSQLRFATPGVYNLSITYGVNCSIPLVLVVACNTDEVIEQTIDIGTSEVICINLPGVLGIFNTVENICPEKGNMEVLFETLENSGCVSYTGVGIGSDTACIKACDFFGFCDTVTLIFHVEDPTATPPSNLFDAVDDEATIQLNSSIVLDILGNDVFRSIDTLYKVSEPNFGEAFINPDATVTYISRTGYCDEELPDTFLYGICEGGICDTATVAITVNCFVNRTLMVYTGMSPNGDGINDSFLIEGIENYPDNSVSIFNRWGNMVFHQDGYKNEWKATWNDRQELPDGTYFYIINLGDGSKPMKGFMQVLR